MSARNATPTGSSAWEKPVLVDLGELASGRGQDWQCKVGSRPGLICGNGGAPQVDQCKSGNVPPSGSCSSGNQGR